MITASKHVGLRFCTNGQAWITLDDGKGHKGLLNLNGIFLGMDETGGFTKTIAINSLAAALREALPPEDV